MILAAIDIGSNAARILIMDVQSNKGKVQYQKLKLLRYPIRLGFDAFTYGEITAAKQKKLLTMLKAFQLFMELYDVEHYLAYATSALRESSNGEDVLARIKEELQLKVELIDGNTEAAILYQTHLGDLIRPQKNYIYVDVGGGSTEVSFFNKSKWIDSRSFKIGTIRILKDQVKETDWQEMIDWVAQTAGTSGTHRGIGSGGNINSVAQKFGYHRDIPITIDYLTEFKEEIANCTIEKRIDKYGFKPDRAEVIVPGLTIYETVFKAANVDIIFVPKIGLSDGIIRLLVEKVL